MTDKDRTNDSVGYKRSPRYARFPKGKSGNPRGRPKGSLNLGSKLEKAASALVTVTESGKRKTLSKVEVAYRQLANKAATGDQQAIKLLTQLLQESSRDSKATNPITIVISEEEAKY